MAPADPIAALQAELDAARAELQEFGYSVAHDLRADVRHILAFAQIAQEDAGAQMPPLVAGHLATISGSARHLGRCIDALSELSRVGAAPLQKVSVPLTDLVAELGDSLQRQHPHRDIILHLAPDLPVLQADAALLRLAMQELLGNAVKFSAPRSPARIEIGAGMAPEDGAGLRFFVRDNGVGFPADHAGRLFRVFQRLHGRDTFEGIGLGLALVRKILQRHGAQIVAAGQVQQGCCMTVTWPV